MNSHLIPNEAYFAYEENDQQGQIEGKIDEINDYV